MYIPQGFGYNVCVSYDRQAYEIDLEEQRIFISKDYPRIIELNLKEAIALFPPKSYAIIDPFDFGTLLFCYKDEHGSVESRQHFHDWEEYSEEHMFVYKMKNIRYDLSYREIEVSIGDKQKIR
jgi:hypothetical protein